MALHRSGNFLREVHDTVKGCQAGNASICYQLISQNAEKIVAYNRMQRHGHHPFDYDDPKGLYSGICCGNIIDENPYIHALRNEKPIECGTMQENNCLNRPY